MKVIFVFAHPDDESFSSGGTIAKLTKHGLNVRLITATRGEKGQLGNPPITTNERLAKVREKELLCAAKTLGISKVDFLDFADGELPHLPKGKLAGEIIAILREEEPDLVVTYNEEGGSRHPDHIAVNKSTTEAFLAYMVNAKKHVKLYYSSIPRSFVEKLREQGLAYNVYGEIQGDPDNRISTVIDISDTIDSKINALKCHKTQNKDWESYLKRLHYKEFKNEFFRLAKENDLI